MHCKYDYAKAINNFKISILLRYFKQNKLNNNVYNWHNWFIMQWQDHSK